MKCAIVLTDGIKQIMLTPENDSEKSALKMITCDDDITIETKWGTFYDSRPLGYEINECMGGYLRRFRSDDSLMLVLRLATVVPAGGAKMVSFWLTRRNS